jgi:hypothetical protein
MQSPRNLWQVLALALLALPAYSQVKVQKISVSPQNPLQLQIQTSSPVTPQTQLIPNPERLVIDLPGALPSAALHELNVNRNEVKRVRVGVFSTSPLVTRIVLDLNSPAPYQVARVASGFTVTVGGEKAVEPANDSSDSDSQPIIGWVSSSSATGRSGARTKPPVVRAISTIVSVPSNELRVEFTKGRLEIHAHNVTLSAVLFQVQKKTGAEIAIPAGTEQERVFVDAGPGPASEVMAELLNGSSLNFVLVGSEADPNILRSVILSRKDGFAENAPSYTPPPTAANTMPENQTSDNPPDMDQPQDENVPPPDMAAPPPQLN